MERAGTKAAAAAVVWILLMVGLPVGAADAPDGAESPEALMAALKKASESQDIPGIVACIIPEERALLSFMIGMVPVELMSSMIDGIPGAAKVPDGGENTLFRQRYSELLAKYEIERIDPQTDLEMRDPAATAKTLDARLGHIDHAAFIRDSLAVLELLGLPSHGNAGQIDQFRADVEKIDVDGDVALISIVGVEQKVQLVARDARWYLRLVPAGF